MMPTGNTKQALIQLPPPDPGGASQPAVPDPAVRRAELIQEDQVDIPGHGQLDHVRGQAHAGGHQDGAYLAGRKLHLALFGLDQEITVLYPEV